MPEIGNLKNFGLLDWGSEPRKNKLTFIKFHQVPKGILQRKMAKTWPVIEFGVYSLSV